MSRLLLLCGSQRAGSLNARLLEELAAHVPTGHAIDRFAPGEIRLPLYDAVCEQDPAIRHHLAALHRRFAMADAFMLASPEYNGLMTPFLKNLIDWISRLPWLDPTAPNVFLDKPVLLCSATPGWSGGALGLVPLRSLLAYVGAVPFGEAITLPHAGQAWDAGGKLDPRLADMGWSACVARFCAFAVRADTRNAA
ncbi:NADPH-dependent FMN reductase [Novosphingobium rosa]|jgi:NAD(P)H-dependent FMN reductase|uniref:NADPH-dependent FMN reductase n=1 Tax=Novosphingobium rosa TaxID=76978 RepID=UPI000833B14A|nr:NAD(P)H-dependent oxidoreductase [Novosphingobium rosa]